MDEQRGEVHIPHDEVLWRRVRSDQAVLEEGNYRISSAAFRSNQVDGLSVHRASLTNEATVLQLYPEPYIVGVFVRDVRAEEPCDVVPDPIENDPLLPDDLSHALIVPCPKGKRSTRLSRKAWWVRGP
jgi:hypothetical protein